MVLHNLVTYRILFAARRCFLPVCSSFNSSCKNDAECRELPFPESLTATSKKNASE